MSIFRQAYRYRDGTLAHTSMHYFDFRDHLGRRQVVSGLPDKEETRELQRRCLDIVAVRAKGGALDAEQRRWAESLAPRLRERLIKIGLFTAREAGGLRPLTALVEAWTEHLRAKGTSEDHVQQVTSRALDVFNGASATFWKELEPGRVEQFLRGRRERDGISARTSNFHLNSARQFIRWAIRTGLASEDPLRSLDPMNVAIDRRRERRALSIEELRKLLDTTERGPARDGTSAAESADGMPGPERAMLYRVAVETGLRRNELHTLKVADLDLADLERGTVRVRSVNAKNRREARLPFRADTAKALAKFVEHRPPLDAVFRCPKDWRAAAVLRADLAAAEIPYADDVGRVVDFHALRTTFGTLLARSGATLQVAQRLMRHSTPVLTSNIYTVLGSDDERAAVASLPGATKPPVSASPATGARRRAAQQTAENRSRTGEPPLLVDAGGAAALLSIGRSTFFKYDSRGDVPRAVRVGQVRRWSRQELVRWIDNGCPPREKWEATT